MLCGKLALVDPRHPEIIVHTVTTLPMHSRLMECCLKRYDSWGSEVMNRLHGCIDLVAAEAIHHDHCLSRLLLHRELSTLKHQKHLEGTVIKKK